MGSKYPVLKPEEIISALQKVGFRVVSQKGSHIKMKSDGLVERVVIIPNHDEVAKGTLHSILQQAGLLLEEFLAQL
jgi:predicted RNA binding protein YcfA (HicA-like mRNA interferase family)